MRRNLTLTDRLERVPPREVQRPSPNAAPPMIERTPNFGRGVSTLVLGVALPELGAMAAFMFGGPVGVTVGTLLLVGSTFGLVGGIAEITTALTGDLYRTLGYLGFANPTQNDFRQLSQINGISNSLIFTVADFTLDAFGYGAESTDSMVGGDYATSGASLGLDYSQLGQMNQEISELKDRISQPEKDYSDDEIIHGDHGEAKEPRDVDPYTDDRGWGEA